MHISTTASSTFGCKFLTSSSSFLLPILAVNAKTSRKQILTGVSLAYYGHSDTSTDAEPGHHDYTLSSLKEEGSECSFLGSLHKAASSSAADVGILGCGPGLACVEDDTSLSGGRCVVIKNSSPPRIDTAGALGVHRELSTACKFENGTDGVKCVGADACLDHKKTYVGCGSCIGLNSCYYAQIVKIGENSCIGESSCERVLGLSDYDENGVKIYEYANIDDNSCKGIKSCKSSYGASQIGKHSCNGDDIQGPKGYYGSACYLLYGTVGDYSCFEYGACAGYVYFPSYYIQDIGSHSCIGAGSCYVGMTVYDGEYIRIGDNSCNGYAACLNSTGHVGKNSCNGLGACTSVNNTAVGDCLCLGYKACYGLDAVNLDTDGCAPSSAPSVSSNPITTQTRAPTGSPTTLNPTESPTSSPSNIPSTSPTMFPTFGPTASPTNSPSKSPSESPTDSPSKHPTMSPSLSPTVSPTMSPSKSPSESPTVSPSKNPTMSPSLSPTVSPTISPSKSPSKSPTSSPTASPTASPTSSPSKAGKKAKHEKKTV